MSDIGATESGRWHTTHDRYKMGATCLVNVTSPARAPGSWASAAPSATRARTAIGAITSAARGFHTVLIVTPPAVPRGPGNCSAIQPRSTCFSARPAAKYPHIPWTPTPGGVDAEQMYKPRTGVEHARQVGRAKNDRRS